MWCWSGAAAVHGLGSNGRDCNKKKQWRLTAITTTAHADCWGGKSLAGVRLADGVVSLPTRTLGDWQSILSG